MTDEEFERHVEERDAKSRGAQVAFVYHEAKRARRVEREQAEAIKVKDATIKALADALWDARQYGDEAGELCWSMSPCDPIRRVSRCIGAESALRLAGRLP